MESPTFTVPTTGVFYDRFTGVGVRHTAGDVITQRRAWILQMAGATEPINAIGLNAEITDPQDGDVPTYDAASGLFVNAQPSGGGGALTELIPNPHFEAGTANWLRRNPNATISHYTAVPIHGAGSLQVDCAGVAALEGAVVDFDGSGNGLAVADGTVLIGSVLAKSADSADVFLGLEFDTGTRHILDRKTLTTGVQLLSGVAVVPPGATTVYVMVTTFTQGDVTFIFDEAHLVSLGVIGS